MEQTWQSEFLPKLAMANAAGSNVAVCSLLSKPETILTHLDPDRIGFVAPLRTRSDLDWLLRTLGLHPNIRHLVLCGDDQRSTGESLIALWNGGLDDRGRLPGSRGTLSPDLDGEVVNALRSYVQVWDWRARTAAEIASAVQGLPPLLKETDARAFDAPPTPKRTTFSSRKTTFPIFTTDVGDAWLQLLNLAMRVGTEKETAVGTRVAETLNAIVTVELPAEEGAFPPFLDFNADDFDGFYRRFTSPTPSDASTPSWGQRLRDWNGSHPLEDVHDRLEKCLDSQSTTMLLLDPGELSAPEGTPALISITFNVVDGKLFGSFVLRSTDIYTDWPFEALSSVRLQREVAERLGLEIGSATFVIHSAHLLERDWARSRRVLQESFERPLPLQVDPSGIFLFGNDGGKARAMLLDHDASTIYWEEAFDDPEDLSWYIVDVMPWLLPQHIRYVGQECAALMRAIREDECYEQG